MVMRRTRIRKINHIWKGKGGLKKTLDDGGIFLRINTIKKENTLTGSCGRGREEGNDSFVLDPCNSGFLWPSPVVL